MERCLFVDYSDRQDCLIELYKFDPVDRDNLHQATSVIPTGAFWSVVLGDRIDSSIIDNRVEGIQGMLTLWHNKGVACLDKGEGMIWGDWHHDQKLLLTYEFKVVQDLRGMPGICRIAYNSHGVRGAFETGKFYTLHRCVAPIHVHTMREMRHGMS
jgi:hypothetical protein